MEIFKDSQDSSESNYDFQYNQIIFNQVTYNPKYEQKTNSQNKNEQSKDTSSELNQEVLNGNFIKSIVLLHENKININDTYNE